MTQKAQRHTGSNPIEDKYKYVLRQYGTGKSEQTILLSSVG
jgi:hypothetical protein